MCIFTFTLSVSLYKLYPTQQELNMENKRSKAIEAGEMYYNTGKECLRGHRSNRMTIDGSCMECRSVYIKEQRKMIRQRILDNSKAV